MDVPKEIWGLLLPFETASSPKLCRAWDVPFEVLAVVAWRLGPVFLAAAWNDAPSPREILEVMGSLPADSPMDADVAWRDDLVFVEAVCVPLAGDALELVRSADDLEGVDGGTSLYAWWD